VVLFTGSFADLYVGQMGGSFAVAFRNTCS
jgi:hypothetical protein